MTANTLSEIPIAATHPGKETQANQSPGSGFKITILNHGVTYTVDNSTELEEFTTFVNRRQPVPMTHTIYYLHTDASWIPVIDDNAYRQMLKTKHPTNPITIYVFPRIHPQPLTPTPILFDTEDNVVLKPPHKARKVLEPIPGSTPILNPSTNLNKSGEPELDSPLAPKALANPISTTAIPSTQRLIGIDSTNDFLLRLGTADVDSTATTPLAPATPLDDDTPGPLYKFNSASTSQTLDFSITPTPGPPDANSPLELSQVTNQLTAYDDNNTASPNLTQDPNASAPQEQTAPPAQPVVCRDTLPPLP